MKKKTNFGRPQRKRQINTPLLVGTIVALAILIPGLYLWRSQQVDRGAAAFVERADVLAEEGQWGQSAEYLFLYLQMRPDDANVRIKLAERYERTAERKPQLARAAELYYQAIAAAPANEVPSLRKKLGELLIRSGEFAAAEEEAGKLEEADPNGASRILALSLYLQAQSSSAKSEARAQPSVGKALEKAHQLNPKDVQLALTLADVYRRQPRLQSEATQKLTDDERIDLADKCLDDLILADETQASAYLARFQYHLNNRLADAEPDLQKALELSPDDIGVLLGAADYYAQQAVTHPRKSSEQSSLLERAAIHYERAIETAPKSEPAYHGLGAVQALQEQNDRAIATWRLGLEKCGQDSVALNARLADALILRGELDLAKEHISRLNSLAARLRQQGYLDYQLGFARGAEILQARLLLTKGDTDQAIEQLKSAGMRRSVSEGDASSVVQALMLLGKVYASQGQQQLAANTYDAAAAARPQAAEPLLAAANAWLAANRPELAAQRLEKARTIEDSDPARISLLGAKFRSQLKLPPEDRNWSDFESSLAEAKSSKTLADDASAWRLSLIEAEYQLQKSAAAANGDKGRKAAMQSLQRAEKQAAASAEGLMAVALAFERLSSHADADRLLGTLVSKFPEQPDTYVAAASVLAGRRNFDQATAALRKGLEFVAEEQRPSLQLALVGVLIRQGHDEQAWQLVDELRQKAPANRAFIEQLLELSLANGKFDEAEKLEESLKAIPKVNATDWQFYEARRLLAQAEGANDVGIERVGKILEELTRQRPEWSGTQLLTGALAERRGQPDKAIDAYKEAIRLGDQRLDVYERLVMLLYQLERFKEADNYLTELGSNSTTSAGLSTLEISMALRSGHLDQALEVARRGAARRPNDPLAQIWLGRLLLEADKPQEAEAALRRALELGPTEPRAYGALVRYFVRTKQIDRARRTVELFAKKADISEVERLMVLAAGMQAIGDNEQAVAHLRDAEMLAPENVEVQERLARALMTSDPAAAEKALRRAVELDPKSATARRALAEFLGTQGGQDRWEEAIRILGSSEAGPGGSDQFDQRLQVYLLSRRRGTENLAKARNILAKLIANSPNPARNDRLQFARLLEAQGENEAAGEQFLSLASEKNPLASDIAAYVDWLLRHGSPEKAGPWLDKLDQNSSDSPLALSLRVRWLSQTEKADQIEPLLEQSAERLLKGNAQGTSLPPTQQLQLFVNIGDLYSSVRQFAAAERWYRQAYDLEPKNYRQLARSLAVQGRLSEAIQLCRKAAKNDDSPQPATTLAGILVETRPDAKDMDQIESFLGEAVAKHGDSPELLVSIANFRIVQQQLDEAVRLYRRIVQLKPTDTESLNNLAIILAEDPKNSREALQFVDQAIQLAGPQPNLLDTKGTILLALGQIAEAIPLLATAAAAPNADPRYYFHLAVGQYRSGDFPKARESLAIAREREFERLVLTASDTKLLAELDARLK